MPGRTPRMPGGPFVAGVYDGARGYAPAAMSKSVEEQERVVVRFAGDSGDGMQLAGDRFTNATAVLGNDLATLPDFPAEIRAPRGTLHGVSAFQIHFASKDILTPGDRPNVLVAMNPAALRANLGALEAGGTILVDEDEFSERNLDKAGYPANPLEDGSLDGYTLHRVPMTSLSVGAAQGIDGLTNREAERSKNFFALGLVSWMYGRPTDVTERWIDAKFGSRPEIHDANLAAFKAGWNFGETTELLGVQVEVKPAPAAPGVYRNVNGATALAWGLIAASARSGLPLFYASYPITPASELLHELSRHKNFGVRTFQAEDEIAAASLALGAAFGGQLGVTGTSGPGMDLKAETIGLAVALELPLVVVDVQRAGPSTGMPTKTEAADLLHALYGRHGESPLPVVAAYASSQCFDAAIEAARLAVTYRTPVILLSDTFLANSSEPWLLPDVGELPEIDPAFATGPNADGAFWPYLRDERLARPWALPGTPGLQHRIGGLEKEDGTGNISYDPENHERMTRLRAGKVARIADDVPELEVDDPDGDAELLVLGWGSTYGAIRAGVRRVRGRGHRVASAHLFHLNPLPRNTGDVVRAYPRVLVPEMNTGQLWRIVRAEFLVDAVLYSKVQGQPISAADVEREIERTL
jgi:2-oxoglutarate ferredoxin oxidoreductase subunit alpha